MFCFNCHQKKNTVIKKCICPIIKLHFGSTCHIWRVYDAENMSGKSPNPSSCLRNIRTPWSPRFHSIQEAQDHMQKNTTADNRHKMKNPLTVIDDVKITLATKVVDLYLPTPLRTPKKPKKNSNILYNERPPLKTIGSSSSSQASQRSNYESGTGRWPRSCDTCFGVKIIPAPHAEGLQMWQHRQKSMTLTALVKHKKNIDLSSLSSPCLLETQISYSHQ